MNKTERNKHLSDLFRVTDGFKHSRDKVRTPVEDGGGCEAAGVLGLPQTGVGFVSPLMHFVSAVTALGPGPKQSHPLVAALVGFLQVPVSTSPELKPAHHHTSVEILQGFSR